MTKQGQKRTHRSTSPVNKDVMDCTSWLNSGNNDVDGQRTLLACELCRHRKTKCDAAKPACGFCADLGVECVYRDAVTPKLDLGSRTILSRLDKLENLIKECFRRPIKREESTDFLPDQPGPSLRLSHSNSLDSNQVSFNPSLHTNMSFDYDRKPLIPESSSIPASHTAAASDLLAWPQISDLLNSPHEPLHLLRLEMQKSQRREDLLPTQGLESLPNFDRLVTDRLVQCYWEHQQISTPILDFHSFESIYWNAQDNGMRNDIESCCVLLVCALGAASFPSRNRAPGAPYRIGLEYYKMAISIMSGICAFVSMPDIVTTQCTCLAAAYLGFLGKPLEQHRLNTLAAASLAQILQRSKLDSQSKAQDDLLTRLFWCCHNTESLILAEIEAPRTNLESLVDLVGMPTIRGPQDFDTVCFSAGIAIRRLFNRVHNALYAPERAENPIYCLLPLASELLSQLNSWLRNIPQDVRPDPRDSLDQTDKQLNLKLHYLTCKHMIHRPFLLHILISDPKLMHTQAILDHAKHCIDGCRGFILATRHTIDKPRDNIWTASQTALASALVLIASSRNSITTKFVPADLESLINISLDFLQIWCGCSPSIEYIYQCLNQCKENRTFRLAPSAASSSTVVDLPSPLLTGPVFYDSTRSPQAPNHTPSQGFSQSQLPLPITVTPTADATNGAVLPGNFLHFSWP